MKAIWRGHTVAESDNTIVIEGNQYFPPQSLTKEYFQKSNRHSLCYWKGLASYYDLSIGDQTSKGAAWYYPKPTRLSKKIMGKDFANYVAFWQDVKVTE
ncbi:MAG TPA: DUF427 domain-containing protein [Candidatus Dormibacteraeota bacterium]|nr:DUF427 domain-containing protein [Candidatus Dormibacteraeota bacterium]